MLLMIVLCLLSAAYAAAYAVFTFRKGNALAGAGMLLALLLPLAAAAVLLRHLFS